ncbi:IS256 family transposase [Permianibacter aggregans]|uniref:IS256 family transposase n=1 Tax=Permianibacter aggregans TaxID=1510150 RepID=UPI0012FC5897|nr:IS256 family transposase [Permianibacter aggregans]QGX38418.1 IS256 family transposase [Permianibacter aggregans]
MKPEKPVSTHTTLDELLDSCKSTEDFQALTKVLFKQVAERALKAEMEQHLGYDKHAVKGRNSGNSRNGRSTKQVQTEHGPLDIEVPRDRNAEFEPRFIGKHQRRVGSITDAIVRLYSYGMSQRDIHDYLQETYGNAVSPALISQVTEQVMDEVQQWQKRPLDSTYAIVYLDALVTKSRQDGMVGNRSVYVALGINMRGEKEILGLWLASSEGAKFWLSVINELKNRGVNDVLIACVDGLKGFSEAINAVYPQTHVQQCIVHQVRHSLHFVPWKERKAVAADLRLIYRAATESEAQRALAEFEQNWGGKYPHIGPSWRNNWTRLTVFFDYPPEIRKIIYTTNAIESLNASLQKVLKPKKAFPNDEAILKVLYLTLHRIAEKWTMPVHDWKAALNQLLIVFGEDRVKV